MAVQRPFNPQANVICDRRSDRTKELQQQRLEAWKRMRRAASEQVKQRYGAEYHDLTEQLKKTGDV